MVIPKNTPFTIEKINAAHAERPGTGAEDELAEKLARTAASALAKVLKNGDSAEAADYSVR